MYVSYVYLFAFYLKVSSNLTGLSIGICADPLDHVESLSSSLGSGSVRRYAAVVPCYFFIIPSLRRPGISDCETLS